MKKILVNGGRSLDGEITVSGSKNAALPIIFACILTYGVSEIDNLPDIGDVRVALDLLRGFGAKVERSGSTTFIDTRALTYTYPDPTLVSKIRASTYLIGSCLSRFGRCPLMSFGGCSFSLRPIDMHIDACIALGATASEEALLCDIPRGTLIEFNKASVGATVNAILLAASAEGETLIRGCAVEPHIDSLIDFLNSCGASISRSGRELRIDGRELHGGKIKVIGDMIEAGSYLVLGLMMGCNVKILNAPPNDMRAVFESLSYFGAQIHTLQNRILVKVENGNYFAVTASPYPGFPTDLQPIIAPLMASHSGGEITDTVWQTRFGYLNSLSAFGVKSEVKSNHAQIFESRIINGKCSAPDLRGGMAALICALMAKGQSEIYSAEIILRGYENLEKKLRNIGAELKIEDI